ncbi:Uncharacterised protein [Klebsiella pneumoniae]|uniref:hypothetical protein n=1 Tax=Enterobacter cloacae complex TaxID=354276 RepID=UPI000DE662CA|nr:hypothetical protein [Enterobacter kobei]MCK6921215.1 hypothetical protein [Enterobacter kobei]SSW86627.1 Uncharacterised protein [Klebsiella pneumoniae]HCM9149591.1 hypothetical protein [Enterobacter roggenkampii]HDG7788029.1 hypothetical protein [Klebsiella quasipneumoniae]
MKKKVNNIQCELEHLRFNYDGISSGDVKSFVSSYDDEVFLSKNYTSGSDLFNDEDYSSRNVEYSGQDVVYRIEYDNACKPDGGVKEWSSWVGDFKKISGRIVECKVISDVIDVINDFDSLGLVELKLKNAFFGCEGLPADIKTKKSLINFLKHYPELRKYSNTISVDYDVSLNVIAVSLRGDNHDGRYMNIQFESDGVITFFSKDADKDDSAYYISGRMFSAKKVAKSYKIRNLFSMLNDK